MAKSSGISGGDFIQSPPKKSRQGRGKHTKYAATSRNSPRKKYRGQGRYIVEKLLLWLPFIDRFLKN